MALDVEVDDIIRNLGGDINFNQPLFEAILNSLEAKATKVQIIFQHDDELNGVTPKMTGFTIIDNGEGFTSSNRLAFTKLWTKNKIHLGCKGSGRFTWLLVYNQIFIESNLLSEQKCVAIPFNRDFDKEKSISVSDASVKENSTKITFSDVSDKYYYLDPNDKLVDKRPAADLETIRKNIIEYLVVKLFFLKQSGIKFNISLTMDGTTKNIDNDSIPDLKLCNFDITSEINDKKFNFQLYYHFFKDGQDSKKVYYCANHRATKIMDHKTLGFSCSLPNNDSFIMLLCSDYFDGKDNDSRSDLIELSAQKNATVFVPLLLSDINPVVRIQIAKIINEQYPTLKVKNEKAIAEAKEAAPHLSTFFNEDTSIVKTKESLLTSARKLFDEKKVKLQKKFEKALTSKKINPSDLTNEVKDLSIIAAAELGEYILYRDNIIRALSKSTLDNNYNEKYIHDIFMPMKTSAVDTDDDKHLLSNLWLIDDKFMTYSYAASDKTVNQIKIALGDKAERFYGRLNRPDLALFYDRKEGHKDLIMVEFKGANATYEEKNKALTELPVDIRIIRDNIKDVNSIWSYIITVIDDDFKYVIESLSSYTELFSNESDLRAYYTFNKTTNAHIYIVDLRTIISDAFARNKTFLDILKKQS